MASTTAMYTGLSGLIANARNLDVIGNNIANVNTTAYKSNRMLFASQFSRNYSLGSTPVDTNGGTNPAQVGLGVTIAGTQRNFSTGSLASTGNNTDMAIEGDGFFIVSRSSPTDVVFTRAGTFQKNSSSDLVTVSGQRLMGYGVDSNYNIVTGTLVPLNIPVGQMRLAEATTDVRFTGNLNAGGLLPTQGGRTDFGALAEFPAPGGGVVLTTGTLLTAIDDPNQAGSQSAFNVGDVIKLTGAQKGGKTVPDATMTVTATSTVQDYMDFMNSALGVETGVGADPAGFTPGMSLDPTTGQLTMVSNTGSRNDLTLDTNDLKVFDSTGAALTSPFSMTKAATADGESVRTTFVSYDSLGNPVSVDLTMVLDARNSAGTTWRYYMDSPDNVNAGLAVGTGTVSFDNTGKLIPPTAPITASISRLNTGAVNPLDFTLDLASPSGIVSALSDSTSSIAAVYQNGTPIGSLSSFSVGNDGTITGAFTNGLTRTIGQVALAKFSNPEGLVDIGNNLFFTGPNSGTPVVTTPTELGTGRIVGGALELSNVDLAQEFINLIQASTGYSASSRVITTTDQLIQGLLVLGR